MRVAGFGFRQNAPLSSLRWVLDAVESTGGAADALATLPEKTAGLAELAAERGLRVQGVAVQGIATPTQSPRIETRFGTGSVAEATALAAAGAGSRIIVARIAAPDGMATCALAEIEGSIE